MRDVWFFDYGSTAHMSVYLLRHRGLTYAFVFCCAGDKRTSVEETILKSLELGG